MRRRTHHSGHRPEGLTGFFPQCRGTILKQAGCREERGAFAEPGRQDEATKNFAAAVTTRRGTKPNVFYEEGKNNYEEGRKNFEEGKTRKPFFISDRRFASPLFSLQTQSLSLLPHPFRSFISTHSSQTLPSKQLGRTAVGLSSAPFPSLLRYFLPPRCLRRCREVGVPCFAVASG